MGDGPHTPYSTKPVLYLRFLSSLSTTRKGMSVPSLITETEYHQVQGHAGCLSPRTSRPLDLYLTWENIRKIQGSYFFKKKKHNFLKKNVVCGTMDFSKATMKDDVMLFARKQVQLQITVLNELSQSQRAKCCHVSLILYRDIKSDLCI